MIKISSDGGAVLSPVHQLTALSSELAGWVLLTLQAFFFFQSFY